MLRLEWSPTLASGQNGGVDVVPPAEPPAQAERPIRLVLTDDLDRSRLTVFFRLFLAIPHFFWFLIWSLAAFTVAFVVWLAVLFERRAPRTLHGFLASYIRYATHLTAYLTLAANPYPSFTGQPGYPVDVEIDPPAPQGRWGAGFRLVLALPALILASVLGGGVGGAGASGVSSVGGVLAAVAVLGWFACVVRARMPRGMRDLGAYCIGYGAQTYGYFLLLTDRYPSSDPSLVHPAELPEHPVRVVVTDTLARARLLVLFRLLLLLPHLVWFLLWSVVAWSVVVIAWLVALVTGRVPRPLQRFLAAYVRYGAHLSAFGYLVGEPFPGFTGTEGSYPIDLTIEAAGRQPRLVTLFRFFLALPALVIASAYGGVLLVIAILEWFVGLFTGRMPAGMRDLGAAAIRYTTQTYAYLLLVTDRYPYSAPFLRGDDRSEQLALDLAPGSLPELPGEPA